MKQKLEKGEEVRRGKQDPEKGRYSPKKIPYCMQLSTWLLEHDNPKLSKKSIKKEKTQKKHALLWKEYQETIKF